MSCPYAEDQRFCGNRCDTSLCKECYPDPKENPMIQKLKDMNEALSKMSGEEIAELFEKANIDPEEVKQYALLEKMLLGGVNLDDTED